MITMKVIKLICLCCCFATGLYSQDADRIESFKIGFFTEKLELTPEESREFWPLYNDYKQDIRDIKQNKRVRPRQMSLLSDDELESVIENFLSSQEEEVERTRTFYADLKAALPIRKAVMVFFVERDFNAKLLQTMRKERRN